MIFLEWLNYLIQYIGSVVATLSSWTVGNDGIKLFNFASLLVAFVLFEVMMRVVFPKNR